jgi:L-seryl-tRNA(Ser) seleniumtransferase
MNERLRAIPSVEKILSTPAAAELEARFGRAELKRVVSEQLEAIRGGSGAVPDAAAVVDAAASALHDEPGVTLRPVVNATGVLIHTNLGRAPIERKILDDAAALIASYSNLEFDLEKGGRGSRSEHLRALCQRLFGCEAAILVNNNAAGTLLAMAALAAGREVLVSRGELVEIGGAFRVPDVIQQGGARLREVGTTNRTRASDYEVTSETAAILRVHRSNFDIVGFTETPEIAELVAVARAKSVPLIYDEGSGRVVDLSRYGFSRQETVRELIAAGVDIVTCSTDKLIGATQGGLILGSAALVQRCARHPLMRALRAGKESFSIIAATLQAFLRESHERDVAIYRMLATTNDTLRQRAEALAARLQGSVREVRSALGGGTTPTETIASFAVAVPGNANELQRRFLDARVPVVGRIENDEFLLDVRTMLSGDEEHVLKALA